MTTSETKRQDMIQIYSDFHKEAYGFRPRYNYHEYTLEQLEADYKRFDEICEWNDKEQEERYKWAEEQVRKEQEEREAEAKRLESLKTLGSQFPELAALMSA